MYNLVRSKWMYKNTILYAIPFSHKLARKHKNEIFWNLYRWGGYVCRPVAWSSGTICPIDLTFNGKFVSMNGATTCPPNYALIRSKTKYHREPNAIQTKLIFSLEFLYVKTWWEYFYEIHKSSVCFLRFLQSSQIYRIHLNTLMTWRATTTTKQISMKCLMSTYTLPHTFIHAVSDINRLVKRTAPIHEWMDEGKECRVSA